MQIERTKIKGALIIAPQVFEDERGYFMELFRLDILQKHVDYELKFCQDNESKSKYGVLRGLHFQLPPFEQSKLVRVVKGKILDVAVDIRKNSDTFGQHVAVELSEENKKQFFIPKGFAHGFVTLSKEVILQYKVDNYYSLEHDSGIVYNDETLNIDWILDERDLILSSKDTQLPKLSDII